MVEEGGGGSYCVIFYKMKLRYKTSRACTIYITHRLKKIQSNLSTFLATLGTKVKSCCR